MSESRTTAWRRRRGVKPRRPVAVCGTRSGYNLHLKRNEPTCDACKAAEREDRMGRRRRHGVKPRRRAA